MITQKYDLWSLGCVFFEIIIWHLWGWEELKNFHRDRITTSADGSEDESYYTTNRERGESQPEPVVRSCVQKWIQNLREDQKCSDFVDLIDCMFFVENSKRIPYTELNNALSEMEDKADFGAAYLTR